MSKRPKIEQFGHPEARDKMARRVGRPVNAIGSAVRDILTRMTAEVLTGQFRAFLVKPVTLGAIAVGLLGCVAIGPFVVQPARAGGRVSSTPITHGPRHRRVVALTFDADMTRGMLARLRAGTVRRQVDDRLFSLLRRTRTPATVFLTGLWTREYTKFARGLARNPLFQLENHSYDHRAWTSRCYGLPSVSGRGKVAEVTRTQRAVERVAKIRPRYFRFPGGCESSSDRRLVARLGLRTVGWDVVSGDAFEHDPRAIVRAVLSGVRPGSIVVAHCIGGPNTPATAAAMARIIPALRARGYRFVTLDHLLGRQRAKPRAAAPRRASS